MSVCLKAALADAMELGLAKTDLKSQTVIFTSSWKSVFSTIHQIGADRTPAGGDNLYVRATLLTIKTDGQRLLEV